MDARRDPIGPGAREAGETDTGDSYILAVDLGTGGAKVALVSSRGEIAAHSFEPTDLTVLPGGGAEQDPDAWWRAITTAARSVVGRGAVPASAIAAVCMSAQWGGTVAVDGAGRHLHGALIWMDGRGAPFSRALTGGGLTVPGTGYNARRLRTWISRTGGVPSRTGKDPIGQIQWLKHEVPEVHAAAAAFLDVPEYLTMRLTGKAVASFDSIVCRWCTDNRDPSDVHYDDELLALCDLDRAKLPALQPPATVIGPLLPEVAAELGLGAHVQVVTGTGDTLAAAVGSGAVGDFAEHLYVGTSAWLSCQVPFKKTDVVGNIASLPSVIPGRYWVAAIQEVAGNALEWLAANVLYADDGLGDGAFPADYLDRLNQVAAKVPPGSDGVLFTPWLDGERTPVDDADVRGGWFNLSLATDRAAMVRSVLEGIALNARWMANTVERFLGRERDRVQPAIRFIGGGAQSPLWCQIMADVLGRSIAQVRDPRLTNVRGAGLIGAAALGLVGWDDIPGLVEIAEVYEPNREHRAVYDKAFDTFVGIYRQNRKLYARHNRFSW